jgi:hypothetical protein
MKSKISLPAAIFFGAAITASILLAACSNSSPAAAGVGATATTTTPMQPHGAVSANDVNAQIAKINSNPNISPAAKQMMLAEMQDALKHARGAQN